MAAFKIQKFIGAVPKIASELLPDAAGQIAFNAKFYSGDLIPYHLPSVAGNTGLLGQEAKTIYGLKCPNNPSEIRWLVWDKDVDIVVASESFEGEDCINERFYFTGDGKPKVSTFVLATEGAPPYPTNAYDLGLPLPTTKATANTTAFTNKTTASYARDTGNTATIVTSTAHGLRTGNIVSITGFTGTVPSSFNATNVEVTVVNSTTITYFSPGDSVSTTSSSAGTVSLAGLTSPRSYVYTWLTPWGEESIASDPSDDIYLKEGQTVTVSNLPTSKPTGDNFIRGIRLYRTIATPSGADYFRLRTLWFPTSLAKVSRTSNVSRVTLEFPHNLIVDDRFKISGCSDTSFNITDGVVTKVVNRNTFEFAQTASDVAEKDETAGTLYHDVSETLTGTARYWGDSSYDFTDDFNSRNLTAGLNTDNYDAPPEDLQGLIAIQNNILAGFSGNQVYFSEPNRPHAWPKRYALTFESNIIAIASVSGYVLVMTDKYPFRISGSDPAIMSYARIDTLYPCLSKRSAVNMGYGVLYATHGGLALYDPTAGADLVTKFIHDWDTWPLELDPASLVGTFYNGKYFGSHLTASLIFERDDRIGGFFTSIRYRFTAAWTDQITNTMYYSIGTRGEVFKWDDKTQPLAPLDWKSKTIVNPEFINIGAARIIADYQVPDEEAQAIANYNEQVPIFNAQVFQRLRTLSQTASYARTGNVATITTAVPHRLITGSIVTVSNFTSAEGLTFLVDEVEVTVVDATSFTYPNIGTNVATTTDTTGVVTSLKGLGDCNGPYDEADAGGFRTSTFGTFNSFPINGDPYLQSILPVPGALPVTFRLWVNKELVFQGTVFTDEVFRLPSGYRSDTFEVAVSGSARIRAIHIGETPFGLRSI